MRMRGLEPPRVTPHDPKSCASASSATSAIYFEIVQRTIRWHLCNFTTNVTSFSADYFSSLIYLIAIFNATNFTL